MTRLLFLPNDQTFLLLESPLPPEEVVDAVLSGQWLPPEPYSLVLAEQKREHPLRAFHQGSLVIITTIQPLELEAKTVAAPSSRQIASDLMFTRRQLDILHGLVEGLTTKEIATRMGLAQRTIALHVSELKSRLGANTRAQFVARAAALGLYKPGKPKSRPGA